MSEEAEHMSTFLFISLTHIIFRSERKGLTDYLR